MILIPSAIKHNKHMTNFLNAQLSTCEEPSRNYSYSYNLSTFTLFMSKLLHTAYVLMAHSLANNVHNVKCIALLPFGSQQRMHTFTYRRLCRSTLMRKLNSYSIVFDGSTCICHVTAGYCKQKPLRHTEIVLLTNLSSDFLPDTQ